MFIPIFLILKTGRNSICTLDKWEEVEDVLGVLLILLLLLVQVNQLLLQVRLQPGVGLDILPGNGADVIDSKFFDQSLCLV